MPAGLKGIFESSLQPFLDELFGGAVFTEKVILVDCGDESTLAPILKRVADDNPSVYIKSLAEHFGPERKLSVIFSPAGTDQSEAEAALDKALGEFKRALADANISAFILRHSRQSANAESAL